MVKKIILMFLSLLTVTVIGIGAYGLTILNQTTGTLSKTYKGFGNETNVIAENKPMTILLMGVDTGSGSREDPWAGNSDTMILVTVNPQTKETTMRYPNQYYFRWRNGPSKIEFSLCSRWCQVSH